MGQVPKWNLVWLFILNVPWAGPGARAVPVEVTVGANPVETGVGWNTTLSVANASALYIVEWSDPNGNTILTLINGLLFVKAGTPYSGRVALHRNGSLVISSTVLADEGNYSVRMEPPAGQEVTTNSVTIRLLVYEPVRGVRVTMSEAGVVEGAEVVTLSCSVLTGTRHSFSWLKDGRPLTNSSQVTVAGTSVLIRQLRRTDAGRYTCRVQNAISSDAQEAILTVYYGPDSVEVSRNFPSDCVTRDQVPVGRSGTLTCQADSVPAANYSWTRGAQALAQGSSLSFSSLISNDSGTYTCTAANPQVGQEIAASTRLIAVGSCLSVGGVVGIVIGGVVALLLLILLTVYLVKRKKDIAGRLAKKPPVVNRSSEVDAKVLPWINKHYQQSPGFSAHPVYNTGPVSPYSSYPPSTGSMVPSTVNGGARSLPMTQASGQLSTLF